jgi:nucleoside-diphosphate-sugar epimerase
MSDKISVFGGTGFIGSAYASNYDDSLVISRDSVVPLSKKVLYFISTVDNYNVFNDATLDVRTNLLHLTQVLENCKNVVDEFIFISSWFVYGNTDLPAKETSVCKPKGFYSITKYAAEMLIESFCKTFNIKYKIIRLGNVIGNGDLKVSKKKNALQYLINELAHNRDINLYNNGLFLRDYIHVDDVVEGIRCVIESEKYNEIYNLSGGTPTNFFDIIQRAYINLKSTSSISNMEPTDFHKIVQVESMYLDTQKIKSLGFICKKNIFDIVDSLCIFVKDHLNT